MVVSSINTFLSTDGSIDLSMLHEIIDSSNVNKARLEAFNSINSTNWSQLFKTEMLDHVTSLIGPDLAIQRKINLSIQLPGDYSSILTAHTDCNSGDSPYQLNIWIPLTNCFDTNSMFVLDETRSELYYASLSDQSDSTNSKPEMSDFLKIDEGDYIIFPPSLIHGNQLNETKQTRVSLNFRVKSLFSPDLPQAPPDRRFGTYYKTWNTSRQFEWANKVFSFMASC